MNINHDLPRFHHSVEIWVSKTSRCFVDMIEFLYITQPLREEDMNLEHVELPMTIYYSVTHSQLLERHIEQLKNDPLYSTEGIRYGITPKILLRSYERILWDEV